MKRTLTPDQTAARDARKAKFKTLWKQVSAMTPEERVKVAMRLGITTCDGHPLSTANSILCMLQIPGVSIVGGFRQWLKHGRCVMKGQKAAQIWVPCGHRKSTDAPPLEANAAPTGDNDRRFITGNVFDISSTCELDSGTNGQDRENYTDTQDRESYVPDQKLLPAPQNEPFAPQIITPPGTIDGKFELLND